MATQIVSINSEEEKNQFIALLENAKLTTGNVACFEFNGTFFKLYREDTSSIWKISSITEQEYTTLTV